MHIKLNTNKTLFIKGPASLTLLYGNPSILGAPLKSGLKVKVRRARGLPVYSDSDSGFDVNLGEKASTVEVEGNSIPEDWEKATQTILAKAEGQNLVVMMLGGTDVGKTTFTVFLVNRALDRCPTLKVQIIDADIGQSDIGPPATIGTFSPIDFVFDLFYEKPSETVFIGATTPSGVQNKMLGSIARLSNEGRNNFNITILNTDGWIDGEDAHDYKLRIVQHSKADFIIAIRSQEEMDMLSKMHKEGYEILEVRASPVVKRRNRDERRELRFQAYQKYLQSSTSRVIHLKETKVSGLEHLKAGSLLGLYDAQERFVGLGVLKEADLERGILKLTTPFRQRVQRTEVGQAVVDMPT